MMRAADGDTPSLPEDATQMRRISVRNNLRPQYGARHALAGDQRVDCDLRGEFKDNREGTGLTSSFCGSVFVNLLFDWAAGVSPP